MLGLILLQTVIEVSLLLFFLLKLIKECSWLLPDGATDSARCLGLCAHCTCLSTMPPWELSADDWKWTVAT